MAKAMKKRPFDVQVFLHTVAGGRTVSKYQKNRKVFSQGDPGDAVFYIQEGKVKVCVVSEQGKEAVVALHGNGDFFGESCLNGHPLRVATVVTVTECVIMRLEKTAIMRALRDERSFLRCSWLTCCLGTPESRKTWSTSCSIPARNVWRGSSC